MLNVKLNIISNSPHTSQIITGFMLLNQKNVINLCINNISNNEKYPHIHLVEAIIDNKIVIAYDLLDGYNCNLEKLEEYISEVDYYFKRSFCKERNLKIKGNEKIFPLGFNYHVTIEGNPINSCNGIMNKIKEILKKVLKKDITQFTVDRLECGPSYKIEYSPKVLFCTRLWSPEGEPGESMISDKLKSERMYINEMRVKIIRGLKERLGNNFIGGISDSEYAREKYPDLILPKSMTDRVKYLKRLRDADICIGSMGLHQSIGWKTGEYIAFSKAIINESFRYEITGDFREYENYLSFSSADECITHVLYLVNNREEIVRMQQKNYKYYESYLKPDMLILNTLNRIINL